MLIDTLLTGSLRVCSFEAAPWSLKKRPGQQRSDAVHVILATYAGMARIIRNLNLNLAGLVDAGRDLSKFDVPEMRPEEEEDDEEDEDTRTFSKSAPKLASDSSPTKSNADREDQEQATTPTSRSNRAKRPRRNPLEGKPAAWADQERIALLKLYRDNPVITNQQLAEMHMARPNSVPNAVRSVHSVHQEIRKLLGAGTKPLRLQVVQAKIDEMEQ